VSKFKVIVGLGNPGSKYDETRHNIGFDLVERLKAGQPDAKPVRKFDSEMAEIELDFRRVLLVKPMTFMNLSGKAVGAIVGFYKIPLEDLLVVCDDLSLPLGRIRLRSGGSDGGQKGLRDIGRVLGTDKFPRLRIGIGERGHMDAADFVLARFRPSERPAMENGMMAALQASAVWVSQGLEKAMNRFNGPVDSQLPKNSSG
jgi:PTH1 family peptidyl-tRNA hydrolase